MDRASTGKNIITEIFALSKKLQDTGNYILEEITLPQWLLLTTIMEMGSGVKTLGQIVGAADTSRQNISKQLTALEKHGFIHLKPHINGTRATAVIPTEKAYDFFCDKNKIDYSSIALLFQLFSDKELSDFAQNIKQLSASLDLLLNNEPEF